MDFLNFCRNILGRPLQDKRAPQDNFLLFQDVLKSNNKALEIIADLGEKGSGEFIFDQHYIDQTLQELHGTMENSIEAINKLCSNRFTGLNGTLNRLRLDLDHILTGNEGRQGLFIQNLDAAPEDDWALVGGKARHLIELRREREIEVPPGFVITIPAFHALLDHAGLRPQYDSFRCLLAEGNDDKKLEQLRDSLESAISEASPSPDFLQAIDSALQELLEHHPTPFTLAVRSSAQEEDGEFSFAGQFHSELHVPVNASSIFNAYRLVAASLFSQSAIHYHRKILPGNDELAIAACCQPMIRSMVSGVAYTLDPANPLQETMVIVGSWGYGAAIVEGQINTDTFRINKAEPLIISARNIVEKREGLLSHFAQGLIAVPAEKCHMPCLTDQQTLELAKQMVLLENRYRRPLDIEWTIDETNTLYILQARPLILPATNIDRRHLTESLNKYQLVTDGIGKVAQQGISCGTVYKLKTTHDLDTFPDNAVLVSRRDSSQFVRIMSRAAAIITETGTPVSHMSTICREMQVPCLVGVDNILQKLEHGEEITVDADDLRIYRGRVVELLAFRATSGMQLATSKEFRLLRRLLKKISLLSLVDPMLENFTMAGCHTYHDILRFIHEKAVQELVNLGRDERGLLRRNIARHLDLPVPVGIIVIDIGGGLSPVSPVHRVGFSDITSEPFRAILQGMLYPGVWHKDTMPVGMRDLMNSMLTVPAAALEGSYTGHNIAIIGANYVNLCFRLGYHFNIIDAYCSDNERDNHIYFRFLGGASDLGKRTRRAAMIKKILTEYGFRIKTRGDLVIARHGNMTEPDMIRMLDILGRLVGFTRQLDVRLDSQAAIDYYSDAFLAGNYDVVSAPHPGKHSTG